MVLPRGKRFFNFLEDGSLDMRRIQKLLIGFAAVGCLLIFQATHNVWKNDHFAIIREDNVSDAEVINHDPTDLQALLVSSPSHPTNSTITKTTTAITVNKVPVSLSSSSINHGKPMHPAANVINDAVKVIAAKSRVLKPEQLLKIVGNVLATFPPVPSEKVIRILVVSYFRSGSTFIGDILQQNWKTFYHFEPLHYMNSGVRIKQDDVSEALVLLDNLFRCKFEAPLARKYIQWVSQDSHTFLFKRNHFLWVACRVQPRICYREDFIEYVCRRAPVQVMKVNRLNMADVQRFVANNKDLDLRVVHLVRDPRGTISSRKVLDWCNTTSCSDFRVLCNEMEQDARVFDGLRRSNPNRYFQLRYEDLSVYAEKVTRQLYSVLGLPFTSTVHRYLRISTRGREVDQHDPYSTRRNSSQAPFAWKQKLKPADVARIQKGCPRVLQRYRYDLFTPPATTTDTRPQNTSTVAPTLSPQQNTANDALH